MRRLRPFAVLALAPLLLGAAKPTLVPDVSQRTIDIAYSFTGAELLLFGAILYPDGKAPGPRDKPADIIVVVRGPTQSVTVREKRKIAGIWMNADSLRYRSAPSYYAIAASRPVDQLLDERTRAIYELGLDSMQLSPSSTAPSDQQNRFAAGLVSLKEKEGLYVDVPHAVEIADGVLYRARIQIPARVPVGRFTAETFLVRDGHVLAVATRAIRIRKSGFERFVATSADQRSISYGLVVVAMAVGLGWAAGWVAEGRDLRFGRAEPVASPAHSPHPTTQGDYPVGGRVGRWAGAALLPNDEKPYLYGWRAISPAMDPGEPTRMIDHLSPRGFEPAAAAPPTTVEGLPGTVAVRGVGAVSDIAGSGGQVVFDIAALDEAALSTDSVVASAGQVGSQIKMRVGGSWLIANVRSLKLLDHKDGRIAAQVDFLGEGDEERLTGKLYKFRRGVTRYPQPGCVVFPVSTADLKQIYAAEDRAHIEIGNVYPTADVRAALYVDALLGKHFALLGSTGTGKSTAAALLLHRICERAPQGHVVMIDPHGEYSAAFKTTGAIYDVGNLQMPYWLMNFEEHCEVFLTAKGNDRQIDADILAKCLLAARAKGRVGQEIAKLTVDAPVPYLLSDLTSIIQNEMGKMDRAGDTAPYLRLKTKLDEIKGDPRYGFMFSGMLVADTMADFIARVFRMPGDGKPISIIDVSGVPSEITSVVVSVLSRMVFDFAIWSRNEPQRPILLVCEEAHRYIPSDDMADASSVGRILSRIAKEGRKYGVSLGLITQRPSDLAEGVLSQCGTIISMRLNNDRDQAFVRAAMPEGARGFLDSIPALRNRECIICGEGVAVPIRVAFDTLDEAKRPASGDPLFSELWRDVGGEDAIIARTIKRWRAQGR